MPKYKFEIHAHAEIIVQAGSAEEARMSLIGSSIVDERILEDDYCISDGVEV